MRPAAHGKRQGSGQQQAAGGTQQQGNPRARAQHAALASSNKPRSTAESRSTFRVRHSRATQHATARRRHSSTCPRTAHQQTASHPHNLKLSTDYTGSPACCRRARTAAAPAGELAKAPGRDSCKLPHGRGKHKKG